MRQLKDFVFVYLNNNEIPDNDFYGGELSHDIIRTSDVLEAVLGLTSNNSYRIVITYFSKLLNAYVAQMNDK